MHLTTLNFTYICARSHFSYKLSGDTSNVGFAFHIRGIEAIENFAIYTVGYNSRRIRISGTCSDGTLN
jgi:hypothetical protein